MQIRLCCIHMTICSSLLSRVQDTYQFQREVREIMDLQVWRLNLNREECNLTSSLIVITMWKVSVCSHIKGQATEGLRPRAEENVLFHWKLNSSKLTFPQPTMCFYVQKGKISNISLQIPKFPCNELPTFHIFSPRWP